MTTPALPEGWEPADPDDARLLLEELQCELPPGHALFGVPLETVAHRGGASDDVLYRRRDDPQQFVVVHLTWLRRTEILPCPTIGFAGSFAAFLAHEKDNWGLTPPTTA